VGLWLVGVYRGGGGGGGERGGLGEGACGAKIIIHSK
jgi:hypothetical protein